MIGQNEELTAFKMMTELSHSEVHGEKFAAKGAIPSFSRLKAFRVETEWLPCIVDFLKDFTHCHVGGVGHKRQLSVGFRM